VNKDIVACEWSRSSQWLGREKVTCGKNSEQRNYIILYGDLNICIFQGTDSWDGNVWKLQA